MKQMMKYMKLKQHILLHLLSQTYHLMHQRKIEKFISIVKDITILEVTNGLITRSSDMTGKRISRTSCWLQLTKLQNKWPLNYDTKYVGFETKTVFF